MIIVARTTCSALSGFANPDWGWSRRQTGSTRIPIRLETFNSIAAEGQALEGSGREFKLFGTLSRVTALHFVVELLAYHSVNQKQPLRCQRRVDLNCCRSEMTVVVGILDSALSELPTCQNRLRSWLRSRIDYQRTFSQALAC